MRLPRDVSGEELARALRAFGYEPSRQTGGHMRLTTTRGGEHHITVPKHDRLRVGTLAGILAEVARNLDVEREERSDCCLTAESEASGGRMLTFQQILDEGRLTDGHGRTVSFPERGGHHDLQHPQPVDSDPDLNEVELP